MNEGITELRRVVAALRAPDGCPWDIEQTHESLLPGLLEECYELIDAVHSGDSENFREELGDILLQTVMHSQMASEKGDFDLDTIARETAEKLIRRHPHVFGDADASDTEAVLKQWDKIKAGEKSDRTSVLDGVPSSLPALARAQKTAKKAGKVGFDWPDTDGVLAKIREELGETEAAIQAGEGVEEEIGDLLFAVANLARKAGIDSELALRKATDKFTRRFHQLEKELSRRDLAWESMDLAALDLVWDEVKRLENNCIEVERG